MTKKRKLKKRKNIPQPLLTVAEKIGIDFWKKGKPESPQSIFKLISQSKHKIESLMNSGNFDVAQEMVNKLIVKCKRIAAVLEESGDFIGAQEVLGIVAKLKIVLNEIYKKKQQKMLEEHYQAILEENERILKNIQKEVRDFNEQIVGKKIFKIKE